MYFTIWYGVYQHSSRLLHYASGGHPPAILLRTAEDGIRQARELATPGMAIGVMPNVHYPSAVTELASGDCLLVLSDGVYEIEKAPGVPLEFNEFLEFVTAPDGDHPERIFNWVSLLLVLPRCRMTLLCCG